jgi:hypothetical protein
MTRTDLEACEKMLAVEEAIAHLNGDSGISRSLWILRDTLADLRKEIAQATKRP